MRGSTSSCMPTTITRCDECWVSRKMSFKTVFDVTGYVTNYVGSFSWRQVRSRLTPHSNLQQLRNVLSKELNRIDQTDIQNLIEGLNRRMKWQNIAEVRRETRSNIHVQHSRKCRKIRQIVHKDRHVHFEYERPQLWTKNKWMLRDDTASAHRALATLQFCTRNKMVVVLHPRIHQILAPATIFVSEHEIQAKESPFWHYARDPTRVAEAELQRKYQNIFRRYNLCLAPKAEHIQHRLRKEHYGLIPNDTSLEVQNIDQREIICWTRCITYVSEKLHSKYGVHSEEYLLICTEMFYLRKLWLFVFGIHNLENNTAQYYCYHEGQATRGPNEVCTLLNDYISEIPDSVKNTCVYDSCGGQNRNNTIVRYPMYVTMSAKFQAAENSSDEKYQQSKMKNKEMMYAVVFLACYHIVTEYLSYDTEKNCGIVQICKRE
ncbi:hypothetical protein ANN_03193 [Periplaneta americana]|uniref:Uncharacterized protein n=1 Tax=Periplaneta americana TaxID=6978 RepID=A0ABQ8TYG3_PERAM|nr:hypothetical protein ANN_03193 [Periplaneta americana]